MPKPKTPPSNVVKLVASNQKPNKPKAAPAKLLVPWNVEDVPWHIHLATWMLRWRGNDNDVFEMLTPEESRFLARMTIWDQEATPNQMRWLNKLADKVETILAITDPNPAA
jgi:hypothetical protein